MEEAVLFLGTLGDWAVDLVVSEKTPVQAAGDFGNFTESGHPLYTGGNGLQSTLSSGFGALGWGSFGANAYNRSSGLGSVAHGIQYNSRVHRESQGWYN